MQELIEKIVQEGLVISEDIIKVDSFLNHQIDPILMRKIGEEFAYRFKDERITKILTIEASGIAVALMTGLALAVPVIFAKKTRATTMSEQFYIGKIKSYTRQNEVIICVSKDYLSQEDRILIIDDFLATGQATFGLLQIIKEANATLVGIGTAVEKAFQEGGNLLRTQGIRVEALARISSLAAGNITFE
ncbi:MAG: xanthine phosphoribosyltransferase [Clostridia bacterium]|nr:xanthine phosphoribosyltransferase [Clostridia bacterium]